MKFPALFLLSLCCIAESIAQQSSNIYATSSPEIINIWHRIGDASDKLRSVESAALSPDGQYAISGGKFGYKAMLWRVADGYLVWEKAHESEIECVTFSPDGKYIATGGEDYFIRVWETTTGREVQKLEHDSAIDGITWSNDGKWLVGGTEKGDAYFWNTITFELDGSINLGSTINSMQFTKNDARLVAAGNIQLPNEKTGQTDYFGFVKTIDVENRAVVMSYEGHAASVKSVRMSPDEQYIASASFDSTACLFNFQTGELLHQFEEELKLEAVAFSADGTFLLTGGHSLFVNFYRLSDYQLVYQLPTPRTEYLEVSRDGRLLLTAHEDSGLVSLYLFLSNTQQRGNYQQIADQQLNNKDLKRN
jgi:WD40 repeat protein